MAEVGPLRVRARVGHRARGLQRERRRVELPPARQGAQQGVPLGRGRHRRPLRPLPAPVFAPAFWNGRDPILKERLFGLTPSEGNHGEDVKEYYFYLDATPTHTYMKLLYKYPQAEYPYARLLEENRRRGGGGMEFELLDTGVFDDDRYFDVFVEYAKADPEDICIRIEAFNRGPDAATLHFVPHLWFRNTWGWGPERAAAAASSRGARRGDRLAESLHADDAADGIRCRTCRSTYRPRRAAPLRRRRRRARCSPTTRPTRQRSGAPTRAGQRATPRTRSIATSSSGETAVNPTSVGTKACLHYHATVPARRLGRLASAADDRTSLDDPLADVDAIVAQRRAEADEFYAAIHPPKATDDEKLVQRQALAGMLWTKQIYLFDVNAGSTATTRHAAARRRASGSATRTGGI